MVNKQAYFLMICFWWSLDNFESQECSCNISEGQCSCSFIKHYGGWRLDEIDKVLIVVFFAGLASWSPSFSVSKLFSIDGIGSDVDIAPVEEDSSLTNHNIDPVEGLFVEAVWSHLEDIELPFILKMSEMELESKDAEREEDKQFHLNLNVNYDTILLN